MTTKLITKNHAVLPSSAFVHVHVARRACVTKQIICRKDCSKNWTCKKGETPVVERQKVAYIIGIYKFGHCQETNAASDQSGSTSSRP